MEFLVYTCKCTQFTVLNAFSLLKIKKIDMKHATVNVKKAIKTKACVFQSTGDLFVHLFIFASLNSYFLTWSARRSGD